MNKSFEELYEKLSEKHSAKLEAIRKPLARNLLVFRVVLIGLWLAGVIAFAALEITDPNVGIGSAISAAFWGGLILAILLWTPYYLLKRPVMAPYTRYFRENIGESFVKMIDPSMTYSPRYPLPEDITITRDNYCDIEILDLFARMDGGIRLFPKFTRGEYTLNNYMTGRIEGRPFKMCCMYMKDPDADQYGGFDPFEGIFIHMKAGKFLDGSIKVSHDTDTDFIHSTEHQKMDSPAFERDFRVGNKGVSAMRYLTADVMELMMEFRKDIANSRRFPQFLWMGDEIFMRLEGDKLFTPSLQDPMCRNSLECCIKTINFVLRLNAAITKTVKETAI